MGQQLVFELYSGEKKLFLTASHMGLSVFILDYAIRDPEAEKVLLDHLQKIEPARIVK